MNWRKEIDLLEAKQNGEGYGVEICEDLREVMELIEKQDHSGMSFSIMSIYLQRLLKDKPIFPLTDDPSEWGTEVNNSENESIQNNRYSALFKNPDGTYSDVDRVIYVNIHNNQNTTWHNGKCTNIIDKMFPITLPYMPSDKPYYVYGEDLCLDENDKDVTDLPENRGSYNFTRLDYVLTPEGEKIKLDKVFDYRKED